MPHIIVEACIGVKDGTCADVCPVDCIGTTPEAPMFYIDPDRCIDCRACQLVCPVDAITTDFDITPEMAHYEAINRDFFSARR